MVVLVEDGFTVKVMQHPLFIYTENYPDWLPYVNKEWVSRNCHFEFMLNKYHQCKSDVTFKWLLEKSNLLLTLSSIKDLLLKMDLDRKFLANGLLVKKLFRVSYTF